MRLKTILIAVGVIAVSFGIALKAMDWLSPRAGQSRRPTLAASPKLPEMSRVSTIAVPIALPLTALRDATDRAVPRTFAGKVKNPSEEILKNADINWTAARGAIAMTGAPDGLAFSTPLTGNVTMTGSVSLKGALGSLLGGNAASQLGEINIKSVNANAEIKGTVVMTTRPQLSASWRVDPNLAAQVTVADSNLSVSGMRMNVPAQVKPMIDKTVNEQLAAAQARIRNDSAFEQSARREWAKICRSTPLQSAGPSVPPLWLESRPLRAAAAQPRFDASAMNLLMVIDAQTRITTAQTKPDCPFPATLTIVPPSPGKLDIAVPVELPFTQINAIVEKELAGKTFAADQSASADFTVKHTSIAASGDRLLVAMLLDAKNNKRWFGFSGEVMVYLWAKPALDRAQQTLRLADIEVAVESEAALGYLGDGTKRAVELALQKVLAEKATVDLKPFSANAQQKVTALVADFQKNDNGARVDTTITNVKLSDIAFDSTTLRVTAEAEGTISVLVTSLPGL